ncbi:MAG TPA: DUF998 domain-containing protein [Candidatus Acidoferrum sp.]
MTKPLLASDPAKIVTPAAWLATILAVATILLLAGLHLASPEFDPSWRMISEYAFGHYGWVLSLMFLCWGTSSWALTVGIWSQVRTKSGKVGLWILVVAGIGEAMASVFDVTHNTGHAVAGLLGVAGFSRCDVAAERKPWPPPKRGVARNGRSCGSRI